MFVLARLRVVTFILAAAFIVALASAPSTSSAETSRSGAEGSGSTELERAHAHNDYEHTRPLYDALDHGTRGHAIPSGRELLT
jgi:hypothetical protein